MSKQPKFYFVEMTDTFAGDANYSWVHRFKVRASSPRGAILKANKEAGTGARLVKDWDDGDTIRHNLRGQAICFFTTLWDECHDEYMNVKEL